MRTQTVLAVLLIAGAVAAARAHTASAHAVPQGSTPASGAVLASPPATVAVRFSEPVDTALAALRVYDGRGGEVHAGRPFHPGGDASALAVRLRRGLREGGYTATFRVVSEDSHPASGGFTFGVGAPAGGLSVDDLLARRSAGTVTAFALSAARAAEYLATTLGIGVLALVVLAWMPALRDVATADASWRAASDAFARRARALLLAAAVMGVCAATLALPLQGAVVEGTTMWTALGDAAQVLSTRFGMVWGLGALAWVAVYAIADGNEALVPALRPSTVGATGVALPGPGAWLPAVAVPLAALATLPALSGHAAAQQPTAVLVPANVLHVLTAGAWIGGLAALALTLPAATRRLDGPGRAALQAALLTRFSTLALAAVCGLIAAGLLQSGWELRTLGDLADTPFGRSLAFKAVLVLGLLACGALNRRRIIPALARAAAAGAPDARAAAALRRTLRAEITLGVAALAISGVLAGQPPADIPLRGPSSGSTADVGPRPEATLNSDLRSP